MGTSSNSIVELQRSLTEDYGYKPSPIDTPARAFKQHNRNPNMQTLGNYYRLDDSKENASVISIIMEVGSPPRMVVMDLNPQARAGLPEPRSYSIDALQKEPGLLQKALGIAQKEHATTAPAMPLPVPTTPKLMGVQMR